ncbi:MAG TPA: Uma2 family endonuclease [Acidobacteriaceae bacterium]|nr:Uma2 family endonuclease [Acidobacteriaceae bacterium]
MSLNLASLAPPISLRPSVTLTDEELMRLSEDNKPYKIERSRHGEIIVMTPVGGVGSTHEAYVASSLFQWNETVETGIAFGSNAGFNLPDGSCLSPDAAWLARHRWEALTPPQQAGYPPLCPDFIIEIRSQSDVRCSVEDKMQLWLDNGAKLAWLIDPIDGNATVYRPGQPPELLNRPEFVEAEVPVAGFKLLCNRLWPAA